MKKMILNHPLINHKLTIMRDKETDNATFKKNLDEIAMLMTYPVMEDIATDSKSIETPLTPMAGSMVAKDVVLVPILRAGLGLVDGFRAIITNAKIGHIGIARNEETLQPVEYYAKFPNNMDQATVIVVDPMLATGGSAIDAIDAIKARGANDIKVVCLVGAPEGVEALEKAHPDVSLYLACLDTHLNEKGYIVPGLGDAGDRLFGTE